MKLGRFDIPGYYVGDCRDLLRELPDESVNCCVTSPPYWGLRDYGTATWEGGDAECRHDGRPKPRQDTSGGTNGRFADTRGTQPAKAAQTVPVREVCSCGARRIDSQLGLERTPEEFIAAMVDVFREVRRVLRADGTCWINIGDSYVGSPPGNARPDHSGPRLLGSRGGQRSAGATLVRAARTFPALKPKDLVGIPWMLAFALRADGWWLRSDVIWHKPNPMPESVVDRPSKAHEYIFLLTKGERYHYEGDAIREPLAPKTFTAHGMRNKPSKGNDDLGGVKSDNWAASIAVRKPKLNDVGEVMGANKRSVWTIASEPCPEAHFAVMPTKLVQPCILAGCPPSGVVLDPFGGSGTVGRVAEDHGRKWLLFDLQPNYEPIAARRTAQRGLLNRLPVAVAPRAQSETIPGPPVQRSDHAPRARKSLSILGPDNQPLDLSSLGETTDRRQEP